MAFLRRRKNAPEPTPEPDPRPAPNVDALAQRADAAAAAFDAGQGSLDETLAASAAHVAALRETGAGAGVATAGAIGRHGLLQARGGAFADAARSLRTGIDLLNTPSPTPAEGASAGRLALRTEMLDRLTGVLHEGGETAAAEAAAFETMASARELCALDAARGVRELTDHLLAQSTRRWNVGGEAAALEPLDVALAEIEGAAALPETDRLRLRRDVRLQRVRIVGRMGREEEALDLLLGAIEDSRQLAQTDPQEDRHDIAADCELARDLAQHLGRYEDADAAARTRLEVLAARSPRTPALWGALVMGAVERASLWLAVAGEAVRTGTPVTEGGDTDVPALVARAEAILDEAQALAHERAREEPVEGAAGMVDVLRFRAKAAGVAGDEAAMYRLLDEAIAVGRPFEEQQGSPVLVPLCVALSERSDLHRMDEDPAVCVGDAGDALRLARMIVAADPGRAEMAEAAGGRYASALAWFGLDEAAGGDAGNRGTDAEEPRVQL